MSFLDIINQEQQRLEQSRGGDTARVEYPQTKHQRLFYGKDQTEVLVQILPASNIVGAFAEPTRRIFLSTKTSTGKDLNTNFTLSPDPDHGSLLENKIAEWTEQGTIPSRFGGQQAPRKLYLVNAVNIIQDANGNYVQERDEQGDLVVRIFEMPQSAYSNLIRCLQDRMLNASGSDLSFMDVNRPSPIKIAKPPKGEMAYTVSVYTAVSLPPLGEGWENQLEDLSAHAVPTERLVNGEQWVQAFIDMKEGRKPNQRNNESGGSPNPPSTNPYMGQGVQGTPNTPTGGMVAPNVNGNASPNPNPNPNMGVNHNPNPNPAPNPHPAPNNTQPQPQTQPQVPSQPQAPTQPQAPENSNGLGDIDAMLEQELGGL